MVESRAAVDLAPSMKQLAGSLQGTMNSVLSVMFQSNQSMVTQMGLANAGAIRTLLGARELPAPVEIRILGESEIRNDHIYQAWKTRRLYDRASGGNI
jgi:hypothetical protein